MNMRAGIDLSGLDQFKASTLLSERGGPRGAPMDVALDLIDFDPLQPRRTINEATLAELAATIEAQGVLEPVSLRQHPDLAGRYIVNRGERRVRASRLAGKLSVPAFLDERVDPYAQVIENLQREDLSPFDLARFIQEREGMGDSRAAIARSLHKPASFITEVAGLIDAPAEVRAAFDSGRVRNTRVLYQLARGLRKNRPAVEPLLAGEVSITRETLEAARGMPAHDAPATATPPGRKVQGTKQADALLVEPLAKHRLSDWSDRGRRAQPAYAQVGHQSRGGLATRLWALAASGVSRCPVSAARGPQVPARRAPPGGRWRRGRSPHARDAHRGARHGPRSGAD
jgi:ParB family chromosome partitioning protein